MGLKRKLWNFERNMEKDSARRTDLKKLIGKFTDNEITKCICNVYFQQNSCLFEHLMPN